MTGPPPPAKPVPVADGAIPFDLACSTCDYNLRSLTLDAVCPECGSPTRRSFEEGRLIFANRRWLRTLLTGVRIILWMLLAAVVSSVCLIIAVAAQPVFEALPGYEPFPAMAVIGVVAILIAIGCMIAWLAAVWKLTEPRPRATGERRPTHPALTSWIIVLSLLPCLALLGHLLLSGPMFAADGMPGTAFLIANMATNLVGAISWPLAVLLLLVHLRRLVRHEPKKGLSKMMTFLIWGIVAMGATSVVFGVFVGFLFASVAGAPRPGAPRPPAPTTAAALSALGYAGSTTPAANRRLTALGYISTTAPATSQPLTAPVRSGPEYDGKAIPIAAVVPGPASQPPTAPAVALPPRVPFASMPISLVMMVFGIFVQILGLGWCVCALVALFWLRRLFMHAIEQSAAIAFPTPTAPPPPPQ